jgi:hypothetical protein
MYKGDIFRAYEGTRDELDEIKERVLKIKGLQHEYNIGEGEEESEDDQ